MGQLAGLQSCTESWHCCHQKFDTYPDTLAEIDEKMHEFQVKADLCSGIDPRVSCEQSCAAAVCWPAYMNLMFMGACMCAGGSGVQVSRAGN